MTPADRLAEAVERELSFSVHEIGSADHLSARTWVRAHLTAYRSAPPEDVEVKRHAGGCPCLHTEPCSDKCTCINSVSSHGCTRCCSYGSEEQRVANAKFIAAAICAYGSEEDNNDTL